MGSFSLRVFFSTTLNTTFVTRVLAFFQYLLYQEIRKKFVKLGCEVQMHGKVYMKIIICPEISSQNLWKCVITKIYINIFYVFYNFTVTCQKRSK